MTLTDVDMSGKEGLWDFSLTTYARPGVAEACLSLQDRRGIDVNRLLHALWCGARGHRITPQEHRRLEQAVSEWHEQVVRPLRGVRRWMKHRSEVFGNEGAALREAIKKQELEAERLEQQLLERELAPPPGEGDPGHALANLLLLLPPPDAQDGEALGVLLQTLWPQTGSRVVVRALKGGPSNG